MIFFKPDRDVDRVFLHCSASDSPEHDDVSVIRRWHTDPPPRGRGWSDVGYHFFVNKDGRIQEGRPLARTPAAQAGNNRGSIAICLHGLQRTLFTQPQYESLIELAQAIDEAYAGLVTFHGHREVSTKSCPVFPYQEVLGLDSHGSFAAPPNPNPNGMNPRIDDVVLRLTDQGPAVTVLQSLLNRRGHHLREDGSFGRRTLEAVLTFQASQGLVVDGIVGPATWGALRR